MVCTFLMTDGVLFWGFDIIFEIFNVLVLVLLLLFCLISFL